MYDKNVILRYLDSPTRIAFWTIDEMAVLFLPIAMGFIFEFAVTGVIISGVSYFGLKYVKDHIAGGAMRQGLYWYLPWMHRRMKKKVKSHIRQYIG